MIEKTSASILKSRVLIAIILIMLGGLFSIAGCMWCEDGVSTETCVHRPNVTGDNSGGAIAVYQVRKSGDARESYARRVSPEGDLPWGEKGTLIGSGYGGGCGEVLQIVSDGSSGAVIAWQTHPSNVTATRVNSQGEVPWQKEVGAFARAECMISDGAGGAIIACDDYSSRLLCLQKIDARGSFPWGENGVSIYSEEYGNNSLRLASDGSGGAIVMWQESRGETSSRVLAQRINSEGRFSWEQGGTVLYTTDKAVLQIEVTGDGSGGAVVVWIQSNWDWPRLYDICAQRVDANGNIMWQSEDAPIFIRSQLGHTADPFSVSDGSGGAIVFWNSNGTIYAQRLNSAGETLWLESGIQVWRGGDIARLAFKADSDGSGGAIIAWYYVGSTSVDKGEILRAQRLDADGRAMWPSSGVPVAIDVKENCNYAEVSPDGLGGAFIVWGTGSDIYTIEKSYVQKIDAEGNPLWGEEGIRLNP